ncbi:MAG: hypothetical protein F9K30_01290 [Dechloromonas sp.]|nr:MAG: hypothetical protein F9K30_01290 [Dechloromonas sp.]
MISKWFDASEAKAFGISLAQDLLKQDISTHSKGKKNKNKTHDALIKLLDRIATFKLQNKLNFYKKAKLGNAFKWTLIEGGYTPDDANKLTTSLLIKLQD